MDVRNFFKKIQGLPESKKKIILWSIVIMLGLILLIWWIKNVQEAIRGFQKEELKKELNVPILEEKLKEMPKIEVPEIEIPAEVEEELRKLKEATEITEEIKK